jgi:acyl-CoA thioester hydrolase
MSFYPFYHHRVVAFHETDMAGVVHFSRQLAIIEEAEHALFARLGIPAISEDHGWPRVRLEVDYRRPLRFADSLEVVLDPMVISQSSVTWHFAIHQGVEVATVGSMVTCHVKRNEDQSWLPGPIPQNWKDLLAQNKSGIIQ